jgi:hypothetical protein
MRDTTTEDTNMTPYEASAQVIGNLIQVLVWGGSLALVLAVIGRVVQGRGPFS